MAGKKLATHVHVTDDDNVSHAFGPDDDVPAWAVKKITHPRAWADDGDEKEPAASSTPARSTRAK